MEPQPDYREAVVLAGRYIQEQDIIIYNRPPLAYYYFGKVYYSGNYNFLAERAGEYVDLYTGADIIETEQELQEIVASNPRGWVIFNPYMKLVGKEWIENNLQLIREVSSTLDDQVVYLYVWGIFPYYSDDFSTEKWKYERYSSFGINRSIEIIQTKYVLYPVEVDRETYVKYSFDFTGVGNPIILDARGNGRGTEHSLTVWVNADDVNYEQVIGFGMTREEKQADISDFVKDGKVWIEFRFYRSSSGDNMPRLLNFSISAVPLGSTGAVTAVGNPTDIP